MAEVVAPVLVAAAAPSEIEDAVDQLDKLQLGNVFMSSNGSFKVPTKDEVKQEAHQDFADFTARAVTMDVPKETKDGNVVIELTTDKKEEAAKIDDEASHGKHKRYVTAKDFEFLTVIGMGAFGKVLQVRNKKSKRIYAMKVISKRLLRRKSGYVENIQAERNIMTKVRHPFVVNMEASFQSRGKLFLVMDFLAGGELFLRIGREGIFLESTAAFYLAEIILALDHLHALGILHRDLKPENILLGSDGHVCLTDFGLAKDFGAPPDADVEAFASTICGTQEYMSPEMIAGKGYGRAADFWSLGCIAYEMLSGLPPFRMTRNGGTKDLFRQIMSQRVKMPDGSSAAACKLLKGFLNRDVQKRWGTAKSTMFEVGGVPGLKNAEFFASIDWDKLARKEINPPQDLSVDGEGDLRHFHGEFTTMALPRSVLQMAREDFQPHRVMSQTFRGFSFVQESFDVPERDEEELHNYWEVAPQEDGESVSECASSKVDPDELLPEPIPEKKRRPPRKRKKKGVAGSAATTPAASTATTPVHSVANTPVQSRSNSPLPVDSGTVLTEAKVQEAISATDVTVSTVPAATSSSLSAVPRVEEKPVTTKLNIQATAWQPAVSKKNSPSATPTHTKLPQSQGASNQWTKARPVVQPQRLHAQPTGWNKVSPQNPLPTGASWSNPRHGWNAPVPPAAAPRQGQGGWNGRPSPVPSSDWTQLNATNRDSTLRSSDWRQHSMSPASPRRLSRAAQQQQLPSGAPSWPNLSDPPLPSQVATPASVPPPKKLQGAWATRVKR